MARSKPKRSAKRQTKSAAPQGMFVPMKVIPLQVYGAWKSGDWSLMDEEKVYFRIGYRSRRVLQRPRQHQPEHLSRDLGPLPDGWDSTDVNHLDTDVDETFVGPKALIAELKRLVEGRDGADERIGKLIHARDFDDTD